MSAGTPLNFPGLLGVYLAANAVPDVRVLVDGPDCSLDKAHVIHGAHDWESTLLSVDGPHRVAFTDARARGGAPRTEAALAEAVLRLDALPGTSAVILTALPFCALTGTDYERVARELSPRLKGAVAAVAPESLRGDWLDGWARMLAALAAAAAPRAGRRRKRTAAVVGHLMDRNEADRRADAAELERLLRGAGLEPVSVWLSGRPLSDLRRVEEAEVVVSLPHGREAARLLAARTGAKLAEAPLPFGLAATRAFVRSAAAAAGLTARGEKFIDAELRRVLPRARWAFPRLFVGKRVSFAGDPHLLPGLLDIAGDAGFEVAAAVLTARRAHGGGAGGAPVLHEPREDDAEARRLMNEGVDLRLSCALPALDGPAPVMELGFPSDGHHALFERPSLGFDGFAGFIDRMAGALSAAERRR